MRNETPVMFRKWKDGTIDAVLPMEPANHGKVTVYTHIGQHSEADCHYYLSQTKPATPKEFIQLKRELRSVGYQNLKTIKRINQFYWQVEHQKEVDAGNFVDARQIYVGIILNLYCRGLDNAYEAYKRAYGESHEQGKKESDIDYVIRCAEQDFVDGEHDSAVYQDVYNQINF